LDARPRTITEAGGRATAVRADVADEEAVAPTVAVAVTVIALRGS
jgi:hypothetical protein